MTENNIKLNFSTFSGNYEITHNGFSWISDGRKPYITIRKKTAWQSEFLFLSEILFITIVS